MASRYEQLEKEYDDRYAAGEFDVPDDELRPGERRNVFTQYPGTQREFLTSILEEEDPLWSDYGKMVASGGIQIGAGVGWLFNNFEWGESLQAGAMDLSQSFMDDLSPQAKRAMSTEFTSRDEGQLWTNNKWSKAKLIAAQSLLGTAAGMGVGSILTRGLAAAGMTKAVQTAAGTTVQVPTRTAGAIGYGLGESGVAAPGSAAGVEEEIMAMSHVDLMGNADFRAVYLALENADPAERARRAKEILAKAAAGDTFYRNMVSTFILSAPLGAIVGGYARKYPLLGGTTRFKSIGIGAGGEATQEFLQSGAEKRGENIAMQRAGFDRPTYEGVLEEAVGGAMAGGMMGGAAGIVTPLDATGQVLPDAESPLAAIALAEQDELDAAVDAELAELERIEREEEDQALRDYMDEEADFMRAKDMTIMEEERGQALEAQRQSQIDEEFRRRSAREAADRGSLPGEPETIAQQQQREYEDELREIWDIDAEEERMQRLEALQQEFDKGRLPHLRGLSLAERLTPKGQRQEETELFLSGTQLAEGEIVAGLPVPTAGRATTTLGIAMEEAREKQKTRAAEDLLKPIPTVADRKKSKMGEPVMPDELVEPPKPDIPPTTKAFNPRRDNIIVAAAKGRGLDKDAWAAEGVDPAEFAEPENAYGSRRAFRRGGMTPDEATEWAAELGFVAVDEHGKGEPHAALDAIMETLGGNPVYTAEGAQFGAEQDRYQAALDELAQKTQRQEGIAGEWDIEVDGVEAHITEDTIGNVTVTYGDNETITERMEGESNRDLVRAILQSEAAGDGVIREKPVEGAPQTEEEQIAFERAEGKRIVDEMIPGDTGMVETTEEKVNDLEDAFFADGWKFDAAEQTYRKDNRVAVLTEIEEGRWQIVWETEGAPEMEPEAADMFDVPELDDVADDLGDQISRLTPESNSTDRNIAVADLGRLKRAKHPRADDLAQRLKDALEPQAQFPLSAEEIQELDLDQIASDTSAAATIPEGRIKKPVVLGGRQFVVTGYGMGRFSFAEVIPADEYEGETTTYNEKTTPVGRLAREGYDGIRVKYRGKDFVLGKEWDLTAEGTVKARRQAEPAPTPAEEATAVTAAVAALAPAAPDQRFKLDWMPATLRVRILGDSAESFSRMDKTSLQAYAIRIGISDQGTKIEIAQRIKDAVATLPTTEIDEAAAQPVADMVERKAKYATKKKLTKLQKEALVKAVALAQISPNGEVLVNDLSARNVGGQALQGLVDKGTIEIIEGVGFYETGAKYTVKYMPKPEAAPAAPAVPVAPAAPAAPAVPGEAEGTIGQRLFRLGEKIRKKYGLESFEVAINNEGEIELYDIEVPVGMQNQRKGSQAIRDLSEFADENSLLIRLEPGLREDELTPREGLDRFYSRLGFTADREIAGFYIRQPGATPETEAQIEDREEREAIQAEGLTEDEELGEIPGFEDLPSREELDTMGEEAATSPESDLPYPSKEQQRTGEYKKVPITIKTMPIRIENPHGTSRNGMRQWGHYGEFEGTEGVDGDEVDVNVNPDIQTDFNNQVYIVDQVDENGNFDEHKVMLGYASELDAVKAYKRNYEKGWKVGVVTTMPIARFKKWVYDKAATKRPASEAVAVRPTRKQEQIKRRTKRGIRYSKKIRTDARVEDAKESVNAPNKKWVAETLRKLPEQAETADEYLDRFTRELETLDEALDVVEEREAVTRAYDRPQVERDTKRLRDAVEGANISVLDDYTQAPAEIVAEMEREGQTDVAGVTNPENGDIYLFSDKMVDAPHANRVTIHEVTHAGLQLAFGDELNPMLLDLANNVPTQLQERADEIVDVYGLDVGKDADKIEMADELVAHGAEHFPNLPIIKKFVARIRKILRKMGFVEQWTENDVIGLMMEAQGAIKRRGRSLAGISLEEEVEVEETGEVFTIERDAQELLTQNEKRKQACERIKSCL